MPKQHFFRKKKTSLKGSNPELEAQIERLEASIKAMIDGNVEVPDVMTKQLSDLKAKLSPNKINAKKVIYNGVEYDSTREALMAKKLTESGLPFEYQVEVEIQEGFSINGETVLPINLIVDFLVYYDYFIDVKGHILQPFPVKWKMLKNKFRNTKKYVIVNKDSEIDSIIRVIKFEREQKDVG